ncbi:hypothetical protein [Dactylosporangium darangshiense]|uniref:hypothetical protein n=1 Tax=Dactylosporangium darangshiense TaxID=579108 RepID=UPI003640E377
MQVLAGAAVLWLVKVGNQLLGTGFVLDYGNVRAFLVALVALAMADVLYRLVEQPFIRLGRRIITWRRARLEASARHRQAPTATPADLGMAEPTPTPPQSPSRGRP